MKDSLRNGEVKERTRETTECLEFVEPPVVLGNSGSTGRHFVESVQETRTEISAIGTLSWFRRHWKIWRVPLRFPWMCLGRHSEKVRGVKAVLTKVLTNAYHPDRACNLVSTFRYRLLYHSSYNDRSARSWYYSKVKLLQVCTTTHWKACSNLEANIGRVSA